MTRMRRRFTLACLAVLLPSAVLAHHSFFGRFDTESFTELEGTVTRINWVNPHIYIDIETIGENGEATTWELETGSPTLLGRAGVSRDAIKVGDQIRVGGYPPVTSKSELFATNILAASGKELLLSTSSRIRWTDNVLGDRSFTRLTEGDPSAPELGIFRVWSYTAVSPMLIPENVEDDFDIESYPLTAAALASVRSFDRAVQNPTRDCMPKGMPVIMEQPYPMEFIDEGDTIRLDIEEYDLVRRIDMRASAPPPGTEPSPLGYSTGRWDGTTLVVTTTKVSWPWFDQLGIPQSADSVIVERFMPAADGSRLDYTLTVTDPANFTAPVTLDRYWLYRAGEEVLLYDCQLRN